MTKRPTMADLAEAAGVSVSTIDRILNKRGTVQQSTIANVLTAAQRLGFYATPLLHARLLENARDGNFGFILNSKDRYLYAQLGAMFEERVSRSALVRGRAIIHYLDEITPDATAAALYRLAEQCCGIAGVMIDAPDVREAIASVSQSGIPVWTLLSDIDASDRVGHVGADPWKMGRGLGWFATTLCGGTGKVALLIGSSDYAAHRAYEQGLRSYLKDCSSGIELLPSQETHERDDMSEAKLTDVLRLNPDLAAVIVAGGGIDGAMTVLKTRSRNERIVLLGTELSGMVELGLLSNQIDAALSHRADAVVEATVRSMEESITFQNRRESATLMEMPIEIQISQTI